MIYYILSFVIYIYIYFIVCEWKPLSVKLIWNISSEFIPSRFINLDVINIYFKYLIITSVYFIFLNITLNELKVNLLWDIYIYIFSFFFFLQRFLFLHCHYLHNIQYANLVCEQCLNLLSINDTKQIITKK